MQRSQNLALTVLCVPRESEGGRESATARESTRATKKAIYIDIEREGMRSGSEAGSCPGFIATMYQSTLGLRVIKKKKRAALETF